MSPLLSAEYWRLSKVGCYKGRTVASRLTLRNGIGNKNFSKVADFSSLTSTCEGNRIWKKFILLTFLYLVFTFL